MMSSFDHRTWSHSRLVELLDLYDILPFHNHPLWKAVRNGDLSKEQILLAEGQHYKRTKAGQPLRKLALQNSAGNKKLFDALMHTYLEECVDSEDNVNHLTLIKRMLYESGLNDEHLEEIQDTPGNIAAISLYQNIGNRGSGCHIIGAGVVEYFYSQLAPHIFKSYVDFYGFSEYSVETYRLHGPMDQEHSKRAFDALDVCIEIFGWDQIKLAVRDAFVATSLHYDGMLQAATGKLDYWNGK